MKLSLGPTNNVWGDLEQLKEQVRQDL